ncbi:4-phosphoerythronate dehydrogenase [Porphyromonas pogonae]|uniref:4-phosphoerythronate dehydrogenase n=1 Tax=Porphyromonas pogonae TaxID=867595 RepID=UPI002E78E619|nr:4-phosphoerythronate dehydrogenase [Porphyromonas pogonae]
MVKLAVERSVPYIRHVADQLAEVTYLDKEEFTNENLKRHGFEALIIRSINRCTAELLQGTAVEFIATATAGYDHIDTQYCREHNIYWTNSPGCNALAVAQYVMCSLSRLSMRDGFSLRSKRLGIVGVGNVGKQVKRLALAMGMEVMLCDPPRAEQEGDSVEDFRDLDTLASQCDIISFHVPLEKGGKYPTYHMIGKRFFESCAKQPIVINACRGAVGDTPTIFDAKRNRVITNLIVDCWEGEPNISRELLRVADIATPHIAGFSSDGKANGARMCMDAFCKYFSIDPGDKLRDITPEPPLSPRIDMSMATGFRIERALLYTFDPVPTDRALRSSYLTFEELRKAYKYPREMSAYQVINALPQDKEILKNLDFNIIENEK